LHFQCILKNATYVVVAGLRVKEVVAHDIQKRFNVSEAVEEQNVTIFATILDHQLTFMDDKNMKAVAYPIFKEQLALMISEEECQVVKEVAVESSKKEKKALAI